MSESKLKVQVLEGADNKLDLAKLEDVLKRKLIIPSYQRPYAWESEDIGEIFQTISNSQENYEDICFFGSIILSKKSNGNGFGQEKYYIIDGQQRLSSFLLILRIFLNQLDELLKKLQDSIENGTEQQIEKKLKLKNKRSKLLNIIQTVDLDRESSVIENEKSILNFIKNGRDSDKLPKHLSKKIAIIYNLSPIRHENDLFDSNYIEYIDELLKFLDIILNKVKFCLICITGKHSEDFAINLFNTLNTTGQPLTAFEVLKSELHTIEQDLSKKINDIQSKIIKQYIFQRKKIITHTGKLLLYLPLYRGDFTENGYTLSDKKFKDQRGYLKEVLKNKDVESAQSIVNDIEIIDDFYSKYWLKPDSFPQLFQEHDEQICFQFLSELKHDRVLPILIRFYKENQKLLGKCVKTCTAFSVLWRAFCDGGTSGIDKAYKEISLKLKNYEIQELNTQLKILFFNKIESQNIQKIKSSWTQKLKTSTIYKNQKLSKLLLFLAYNQRDFDPAQKLLRSGKGINILTLYHWKDQDYKTIEHIIPKSDRSIIGHTHTLGNLTLLPQVLNSSLGNKPFSDKLKQYKIFTQTENKDKYPYLPIIAHIAHYNQFEKKEIESRSEVLAEFIWKTLAEDWLGWEK